MDIDEIRDRIKILAGKKIDFDVPLTFYYDETNNVKKLHLKKGDFNVDYTANFVLGGYAYIDTKPDVADIFDGIPLQATVNEVKLKLIAKGDFEECLTSERLKTFLTNIFTKPLFLHISTLNLLYYSLVDIVDSAPLPNSYVLHINEFKSALYMACRAHIDVVMPILHKYTYPNVPHETLVDFVEELMQAISLAKKDAIIGRYIEDLHKYIAQGAKEDKLPFITDEDDHMLIRGLMDLYARPIYMFINSDHVFDNEGEIKEQLNDFEMLSKGQRLTNYSFLDSKNDNLIQASDVTIGLFGKFFKFLNTHPLQEIIKIVKAMSDIQLDNIDLLLRLIRKSFDFNEGLIHFVDSLDNREKIGTIGNLRGINLST